MRFAARERCFMKKKFDCVKFQHEARKKLGAKYPASRSSELMRDLEQKYGHLRKREVLHPSGR